MPVSANGLGISLHLTMFQIKTLFGAMHSIIETLFVFQ